MKFKAKLLFVVVLHLALVPGFFLAHAEDQQFLSADAFIEQAFHDQKPTWRMLTLNDQIQAQAKQILGHEYAAMRTRYWQQGHKTAWILDEIGKEKPITIGVVVNNNAIESIQILVYRELRGGEVAQSSFMNQFRSTILANGDKLSKPIDSIAGATLSVRAVTDVARLALLFNRYAITDN